MAIDRAELRAWLEANCPPEMCAPAGEDDICWGGRRWVFQSEAQKLWLERCAGRGFTVPTWPKEYGGAGYTHEDAAILKEEMRSKGNSIEGGTSEIMLDIVAKRLLELPAD